MYGPCLSSIGGGQALTSPRRHSLGRLLPYQLADTEQAAQEASYDFIRTLTLSSLSCIISIRTCLMPNSSVVENLIVVRQLKDTMTKLVCGTIENYPVFRRAMPDFKVRSYFLLPRLPVSSTTFAIMEIYPIPTKVVLDPLTCMPYPRRQRSS